MSESIIKVTNSSYAKYEEVLMKRDEVRKEAFLYERAYTREFGELILRVFRIKMECIKKKKTIEYCQRFANRGEAVDQKALQKYLEKELAEYEDRLEEMIHANKLARQGSSITEAEIQEIKRIYHRLVKKIHPDINPLTGTNDELSSLWHRLTVAYNCNDLLEMRETEVLVNAVLKKLDMGTVDVTIPDIDEKIADIEAEIVKITTTEPYTYRFLLGDPKEISEKKKVLRKELDEYEEYEKQLEEILNGLLTKGVVIKWQMN